jgi:high-affinity K+ transport system ATPase subunit B
MGMRELERLICASARVVLNNRKLRVKDIMEWSTGEINPQDGEVVIRVADLGVWVAVKKEHDKRK